MPARLHVRIRGDVQGVFFRQSTANLAQSLNLTGWVRNLPNGDVEAEFEGPAQALQQILEWCRHGPPSARVTGLTEQWKQDASPSYPGFHIR